MKKSMFVLTAALAAASALAVPNYVLVNTVGKDAETAATPDNYKAYYCTKAAAAEVFRGRTTVESIAAYLTAAEWLYADAMKELSGGKGTALNYLTFDDGEYSFVKDIQSLADGEYITVLAYTQEGVAKDYVRVFGSSASDGALLFAPGETGGGTASEWAQAPEPTSGILLLLGVAGLALKRKRA